MLRRPIFCVPRSDAVRRAAQYLSGIGLPVTDRAAPDISHLLLPVPSFSSGTGYLAHLLTDIPDDIVISGGFLDSPLLQDYRTVDFLKDPYYLAENAAITASCAVTMLKAHKRHSLNDIRVLVIGWGRIGKCLCRLLEKEAADVTVAVRKDSDRAMISALDCRSISIEDAKQELHHYDAIVNTVPEMILPDMDPKPDAVLLELASRPGMRAANIIDARGLPGKMAPEQSGELIAKTFIRLSLGKEQ